MKYGYHFHDWGLWDIEELIEVSEMQEDYVTKDCFGTHVFKKEEWAWVKATKPIFLIPSWNGEGYHFEDKYEGPYYKKDIFDTKEEAEEYAKKHSSCFWY